MYGIGARATTAFARHCPRGPGVSSLPLVERHDGLSVVINIRASGRLE